MASATAEAILLGGVITVAVGANVLKGYKGSVALGARYVAGAVTRALPWIFTAFVLTAKTGIDYRKLRRGQIDKREFARRFRTNTVTGVFSICCAIAGGTAGFCIGTVIVPGFGSVVGGTVGTLVGAITVGFMARKVSTKGYSQIEDQIEANR